jgi:hypothetical protein
MTTTHDPVHERYYDAVKRVRNRLRTYPATDLVLHLVRRLHGLPLNDIDVLRRQPPWILLLLLKWAIMYGVESGPGRRAVNDVEVNKLINLMHEVDGASRLPSEHPDFQLFLRSVAYQQFWHQERPSRTAFARQAVMFGGLPASHRLRRSFVANQGIDLNDWVDLLFVLAAAFLGQPRVAVSESFFATLRHRFSRDVISRFLGVFSQTLPALRRHLADHTRHDPTEFRERSPLERYPLLRAGGEYLCFHRPLLLHAVEDNIYDTLRAADAQVFMDDFGSVFEAYVRRGLEFMGQPFMDEAQLRTKYGPGKVTDFALMSGDGIVVVDAKGVDVGHQGMTAAFSSVLADRTRSSAIKALAQAGDLVQRMRCSHGERRAYLLVVTYKNLYLGNGSDFVRAVGGELLRRRGFDPDSAPIQPQHVYFASVGEFEHLVSALGHGRVPLDSLLASMAVLDEEPGTRKFMVQQHLLERFGRTSPAGYLEATFDAVASRVAQALGEPGG